MSPDKLAALEATRADYLKREEWLGILSTYAASEVLDAFETRVRPHVSGPLYWYLLRNIWSVSENHYAARDRWLALLRANEPCSMVKMSAIEHGTLAALPEQFLVYRGAASLATSRGLSWTQKHDLAVRYSRYSCSIERCGLGAPGNPSPVVLCGVATRSAVLLLLADTNELVIHPDSVAVVATQYIDLDCFHPWPSLDMKPGRSMGEACLPYPPTKRGTL